MQAKTLRVIISGRVQGVGFRYWVRSAARDLGVDGWVRNRRDGRVEAVYSGTPAAVDRMLDASRQGPGHASVDGIQQYPWEETVADGFHIVPTV